MTRSFGDSIYTRKGNVTEAKEGQSNLSKEKIKISKEDKDGKRDADESANARYKGR